MTTGAIRQFHTLVVGGGPAGIAAAVCAAEQGVSVGLIDDNPSPGGQIWRKSDRAKNTPGSVESKWRNRLLAAPVVLLQGWSVCDQPSPMTLRAERQGETVDCRYERLILATGARERFLPFPGWTLPNVMGIGALQAMVKGGLPVAGRRIVIAGSGPLLLAVAAYLNSANANVICVCEQASFSQLLPFTLSLAGTPGKIVEGFRYKAATWNVPFHSSSWAVEARGDSQLRSVMLLTGGKIINIACDYLACAFHLVPNIELPAMLSCRIENGVVSVDQWQRTSQSNIYCAGEPTGIGGVELSLIEGQIAGLAAADQPEKARGLFGERTKFREFAARLAQAFALRPELKSIPQNDTFVCRCEDVAYGAVRQHHSWRSAKLHTRCGMGICQGRICGPATEFLLGWSADSTRPPVFPARIASLASEAVPDPHSQEAAAK